MKGVIFLSALVFSCIYATNESKDSEKKSWKDKDIRDMTDADMERLLDQWEENDEPLEPDELPEHLRPSPKIDMSQIDMSNPDNILRMTKKGKGVMMFVDIMESVSIEDANVLMGIWTTSLHNSHIVAERYPIDSRRSVYLFREGSQAIDAKQFFLEQPELSHITLEGQTFYGKHSKQNPDKEAPKEKRKKEPKGIKEKKTEL